MLNSWLKSRPNNPPTISQARIWLNEHWPLGQTQPALVNWLLSFIVNQSIGQIIAYPERSLTSRQWQRLQKAASRLSQGYPLAYLTRQQPFYNLDFKVSPAVLIPRPESECLIDLAKQLRSEFDQSTTWLDLGTGSGCLIVTLAKDLQLKDNFNGSDISWQALRLARQNAANLSAKVNWRHGSLLKPWLRANFATKQIFILANLPYLAPADYQAKQLELQYEPKLALLGGSDGLDLFRQLAKELPTFIKLHPQTTIHLLTESSLRQVDLLPEILANSGLAWQKFFPDLTGRQRFGWWHN